jgi:hypothetical protein
MAGSTITDAALEHAGALIAAARTPSPDRGSRAVAPRAAARRARTAARAG